MMGFSANGRKLLEELEGFRDKAYQDSGGVWTIGYGHTPATPGQTVTQPQADLLLSNDIARFLKGVVKQIPPNLPQHQFDALLIFAFNIGLGPDGFDGSSVLRLLKKNQPIKQIAQAFLLWDKIMVNNQLVVCSGLVKRRATEAHLFDTGLYEIVEKYPNV